MPAASYPIPSPDRNHAPTKRLASTTPYSQGFRFLNRRNRRRFGSPWVGPINATLERHKLATVTPGATSTRPAASASLFLCQCLDAFSSFLTHPAINLQLPSRSVLYQTLGSRVKCGGAPVPRDAKLPKILCHALRPFFLLPPPGPRFTALPT